MNNLIYLERKTAELTEDITDILHAANINFQALLVEIQKHPTLVKQFYYLHTLLKKLQGQIDERPHLHMSYLITKQIQEEEKRVRRERISQYQDKIYDQRRIIADKEGFYQSLLRPKKKKLPSQGVEEFQQMRAKQKEAQEKRKIAVLLKELTSIQALKRHLEHDQKNNHLKYKKCFSQRQKVCSISNVNSTGLTQGEFGTEKIIPLEQKTFNNHKDIHGLARSSSLQHTIRQTNPLLKVAHEQQQHEEPNQKNICLILQDIIQLKNGNSELHNIYNQQVLIGKFKKQKYTKLVKEYESVNMQNDENRKLLQRLKEEEKWRYVVCQEPIRLDRRSSSSCKKGKFL